MKIIIAGLTVFFFTASLLLYVPGLKVKKYLSQYASPSSLVRTPSLAGDVNGDGRVDGSDYSIIVTNMGKKPESGLKSGDLNGDGIVDNADVKIYLLNYSI